MSQNFEYMNIDEGEQGVIVRISSMIKDEKIIYQVGSSANTQGHFSGGTSTRW